MGKCDETMYHYLAEPERFADLFNAGCFHGRQLVEAGKLEQLAERVQLTERPKQRRSRKYKARQKSIYRDIRMKLPDGSETFAGCAPNARRQGAYDRAFTGPGL